MRDWVLALTIATIVYAVACVILGFLKAPGAGWLALVYFLFLLAVTP